MTPFTIQELQPLLAPQVAPCISIFLPTHRRHPGTEQDPIRFKNLLEMAKSLLRERYAPKDIRVLLEPLGVLSDRDFWRYLRASSSKDFWRAQVDGLAAFRSPDLTAYYRIPMRLPEVAVVADTFHVKPLIQFLQSTRRFFVLVLSRKSVAFYEGTPYSLGKVEVPDLPAASTEALGIDRRESSLNLHSSAANGAAPIFHSHGGPAEDKKADLVCFFRVIDSALWRLLRDEHIPLVLVGVSHYHPIYRAISRYPSLAAHGVEGNFERATPEEIHAKVWPIVSGLFQAWEDEELISEYARLAGRGQATHDLHAIAQATVQGRVCQLLVAEGVHLWGMLDRASGNVIRHPSQQDTCDDDVLDDLAECVLTRGGKVLLVPGARMPSSSPLAATLRW